MEPETILKQITELLISYGPRLVGAIVVWLVGSWLIRRLSVGFARLMDKRDMDPSLKPFLRSMINILLKIMLVISVLTMLGIEMTSFIAILGAAGLAVGMALSGTLQNFAGGVMILTFKPFKVGDFVEAGGYTGTVKAIQIFNTILTTPDNKTVIIPNGGLSNSSMVNFSTEPLRRVDFTFGIGYGDSTEKGREVLMSVLNADARILSEPAAPMVVVSALADSSVNFTVRVWVKAEDYWGVNFDTHEKVYNEFNRAGINIPFPQMDVHLHKSD